MASHTDNGVQSVLDFGARRRIAGARQDPGAGWPVSRRARATVAQDKGTLGDAMRETGRMRPVAETCDCDAAVLVRRHLPGVLARLANAATPCRSRERFHHYSRGRTTRAYTHHNARGACGRILRRRLTALNRAKPR